MAALTREQEKSLQEEVFNYIQGRKRLATMGEVVRRFSGFGEMDVRIAVVTLMDELRIYVTFPGRKLNVGNPWTQEIKAHARRQQRSASRTTQGRRGSARPRSREAVQADHGQGGNRRVGRHVRVPAGSRLQGNRPCVQRRRSPPDGANGPGEPPPDPGASPQGRDQNRRQVLQGRPGRG